MQKEKKIVELNDEDLEKVNGGGDDEQSSSGGTCYDCPHRSEPVNEDSCPFGTCGTCSSYRNGCCYYDGCQTTTNPIKKHYSLID